MDQQKKLTFMGHLHEVRRRLLYCLIAVGITTVGSFFFARHIFDFLASRAPADVPLIYTQVTEMLGIYIKVALYCGIALALPFIVYQAIMFIAPALTRREQGHMYPLLLGVAFFFIAGVAFTYFILFPPALNFLLDPPAFLGGGIAEPMISIGNYVSLLVRLMFWIGVVFEIPILMLMLSRLGIVSPGWLLGKWKWSVLIAFLLGALITPTMDPINQTLVAIPVVLLYGIGVLLAWIARPQRKRIALPEAQAGP